MSIRALLPLALLLALGVGLAASPVLVDSANADVLVPGQRRRPRPRPRPRPDPKPPLVAPSRPIVIATLTSPAFAPGKDIPTVHTCEGADTSPALRWDKLPRGTVSVAIIVRDPDAPDPRKPVRTWHHWVLWDLPPEAGGPAPFGGSRIRWRPSQRRGHGEQDGDAADQCREQHHLHLVLIAQPADADQKRGGDGDDPRDQLRAAAFSHGNPGDGPVPPRAIAPAARPR